MYKKVKELIENFIESTDELELREYREVLKVIIGYLEDELEKANNEINYEDAMDKKFQNINIIKK